MLSQEEEAYAEFADTFGPRLRAYFVSRGLVLADAEDLAVSCVTDIALKVDRYRQSVGGGFEAWVFTLARHALSDWRRTQLPTEPLDESLLVGGAGEDKEEKSDIVFAVREALERLPDADRMLILLRDLEGEHSYQEIGERMNIRQETARVRHSRALAKLKSILEYDPRVRRRLARSQNNPSGENNE
jgi:RNA polymerase sigma factor (sigma-70 family)